MQTANRKGRPVAKVTITVETDGYSKVAIMADDPAEALARCIYRIAEHFGSDRMATVAEAVHRTMRDLKPSPWQVRSAAIGGGPCMRCGEPFYTHVCLSCSPNAQTPGPGCVNCRHTGMDQTPCQPLTPKAEPPEHR